MPDEEKFTREQLLLMRLRDERCGGNAAELARRLGKDPTYVNRLLYPEGKPGRKGVGLEIMRAATEAFDLPAGWFGVGAAEEWPFTKELRTKVLALSDEELYKLERAMRAHLDMPHISLTEFSDRNVYVLGDSSAHPYPARMEDGAGLPEEMQVPAPQRIDGRSATNRRRSHAKGGGGA